MLWMMSRSVREQRKHKMKTADTGSTLELWNSVGNFYPKFMQRRNVIDLYIYQPHLNHNLRTSRHLSDQVNK